MEKRTIEINNNSTIIGTLESLNFSQAAIRKLLKNKDVKVNGARIKEDAVLSSGDTITIFYTPDMIEQIETIYEDENIIIVNKPFGIETTGENSLENRLNAIAVHRLDRNTTGLTIFAKNRTAEKALLLAFKEKKIIKKYYAEVFGQTDYNDFTFNAYLIKNSNESKVKIYDKMVKGSQSISTTFNTIRSTPLSSLIECTLHTGKTHQIRASLAYLGHPIIGDGKYGTNEINKNFSEKKQRLHCHYLQLIGLNEPLNYLNGKSFSNTPKWVK